LRIVPRYEGVGVWQMRATRRGEQGHAAVVCFSCAAELTSITLNLADLIEEMAGLVTIA